jgi:hypothetical protein
MFTAQRLLSEQSKEKVSQYMTGYSADLKGQPGLSYLSVEKVSAIL